MTTGSDDVLNMLEAINEKLERLSLEHKIGDPKRERELDDLRAEAREAMQAFSDLERAQATEDRLAIIFDELRKNTALAHKRLEYVEDTVGDRNGSAFPADPKILAEGKWLKGMLAGPPTEDVDPGLLMNAPRPRVRRGLDELAVAVLNTTSARETFKNVKGVKK